jgi:signal transduction histidine kinase
MLDIPNILLSITTVVNAGLIWFVYERDKKNPINRLFAFFVMFIAIWALFILEFRLASDEMVALYFMKAAYVSALLLAVFFYYFSFLFPDKRQPSKMHAWLVILATTASVVYFVFPGTLVLDVTYNIWGKGVTLNSTGYTIFATLFILFFIGGQLRLLLKIPSVEGAQRRQLLTIATSVIATGIFGMYYNLVLPSPVFKNFEFIWTGPIFTFFFATIIIYSVFRYRLFNPKALVAELLVFILWLVVLIRMLLADELVEQLLNGGLLLALIVVGLLLIKSVNKEVEAREKIEELAGHLEDANVRLKELDRQKSEFLSMAAHQLRTPLTSIKGYASMMLEGSYGDLPDKVDNVLETIFASSSRMVDTVSDFLNVSRIEQGKMEYRMENTDLGNLAKSVVIELALSAKEKGLDLNFHDDGKGPYPIHADTSKLEHVVSNLVDNAIKYTPKGAVSVRVEKDSFRNIGIVKVIDTGAGIPSEALSKLFDKFVRARNAHEINVTGTGLGLYVAREMMDKHDGKIWAESKGEGKGSTFFVEIPLKKGSD